MGGDVNVDDIYRNARWHYVQAGMDMSTKPVTAALALLHHATTIVAGIEHDRRNPVVILIQACEKLDRHYIDKALWAFTTAFRNSLMNGDDGRVYCYGNGRITGWNDRLSRLDTTPGIPAADRPGYDFLRTAELFDRDMRQNFDTDFAHTDYRPTVIHLTSGGIPTCDRSCAIMREYRVFNVILPDRNATTRPLDYGVTLYGAAIPERG